MSVAVGPLQRHCNRTRSHHLESRWWSDLCRERHQCMPTLSPAALCAAGWSGCCRVAPVPCPAGGPSGPEGHGGAEDPEAEDPEPEDPEAAAGRMESVGDPNQATGMVTDVGE